MKRVFDEILNNKGMLPINSAYCSQIHHLDYNFDRKGPLNGVFF